MARLKKLDFAELAPFIHLLDEQEFARIDDGFHHHVFFAHAPGELHDLSAVLDACGHRHGAGDMFARFQRCNRLPGVIGNRRVDVDRIDIRIFEQLLVIGVASFHSEGVANGIQLLFRPLADGVHVRIWVTLINGNELGSEPEANYGDVYFTGAHRSESRCAIV